MKKLLFFGTLILFSIQIFAQGCQCAGTACPNYAPWGPAGGYIKLCGPMWIPVGADSFLVDAPISTSENNQLLLQPAIRQQTSDMFSSLRIEKGDTTKGSNFTYYAKDNIRDMSSGIEVDSFHISIRSSNFNGSKNSILELTKPNDTLPAQSSLVAVNEDSARLCIVTADEKNGGFIFHTNFDQTKNAFIGVNWDSITVGKNNTKLYSLPFSAPNSGDVVMADLFGNLYFSQPSASSLQAVTDIASETSHTITIVEPAEGIKWVEGSSVYGSLYLDNSGVNFSESDDYFSFKLNRTNTTRSNQYYIPDTTGIFVLSVNNATADELGNISIPSVISGSISQVGTATTTFTVSIGSTQPNNTYQVAVTPTSSLSAALFYVTNKTTTTFDVVYLAGLTGTVTFDWILTNN